MPISLKPRRSTPWLAISQSPGKAFISPRQDTAWLDGLITATTAVRDTCGILAFPCATLAANLVLQVLQAIQRVHKNQDDFQELAQDLVQIITTMRDMLRHYFQDCHSPCLFMTQFQAFIESLLALLSRVNDLVRFSQSWRRYLNSATIQETIERYRQQFDALKADFALTAMMHLSIKIFSEHTPRQLGYTWDHSESIRLIDAMNDIVHLPFELCSSPSDFADLLQFLFRRRRGRGYVERGQYALTAVDKGSQRIDSEFWRTYVRPGHTIAMNILIWRVDTKAEVQCCPSCSCGCVAENPSLCDEITCPTCATIFRISLSAGDPNPFASFTDSEEADVKYFRRFHVVLEDPCPLNGFVAPEVDLWTSYPSDEFDSDYLEGANLRRIFESWIPMGSPICYV